MFLEYPLRIMASPVLTPALATRRGRDLVVPRSASLPAHCLKCGTAASIPWRKKFYWHNSWVYFLILLNLLIYIIVAVVVRKQMELNLPLCDAHHADRKRYRLLGTLMLIGFVPAGLVLGANFSETLGWTTGALMFVAGLVFWQMSTLGIRASKIDEAGGVFRGASKAFLDMLPEQSLSQ
jgi:hypothetical protein